MRCIRQALALASASSAICIGAPTDAYAGVVPTQWIAKVTTESLGRPPAPSGWNQWVNYYSASARACNYQTLGTLGRQRYKSAEFLGRGYDNAEKMVALYRGALNREPREIDIDSFLPLLDSGDLAWNTLVDGIFSSAEFRALAPRICDPHDPGYGFDQAPVGDVKDWTGGGPSRTQRALQIQLDAARATCGRVELEPKEVIRIGGVQPGPEPDHLPLRIPACVTLTTPRWRVWSRTDSSVPSPTGPASTSSWYG
jgi:hypothetical protein